MNPFQAHGITHLSASQLSTFCADSSYWFATKVLGYRGPVSYAMERGKAAEAGVVMALKGESVEASIDKALRLYDEAGSYGGLTGDAEKERDAIPGMIEQAVIALAGFGKPQFADDDAQVKVELNVRFGDEEDETIPLIGFLDLVFDERIIDLKTTHRIPSEMSLSHRLQCAIYQRHAKNMPVDFCYCSTKKHAFLAPENVAADQQLVRDIVKRMAKFLALGDSETLRDAVPIVFDSWSWRGLEGDRRKYLGA